MKQVLYSFISWRRLPKSTVKGTVGFHCRCGATGVAYRQSPLTVGNKRQKPRKVLLLSVRRLPTLDPVAAELVISAIMRAAAVAFAVIRSQLDTSLCQRKIKIDEASRTTAASISEKA